MPFPLKDFERSNDRITTLLSNAGLNRRFVNYFDEKVLKEMVEWDEVDKKMGEYRKSSIQFIQENILNE